MPVVFDRIDTEIAPETRAEPKPAESSKALDNAQLAELVRQELMTLELRRKRLSAD
jgi:hypothetical protein